MIADEHTTVRHRPPHPRDLPYITKSWLRGGKRRFFPGVPDPVWYHWHHRVLEVLIPSSEIIVAHDREDFDRILGFGVARFDGPNLIVHYMHVRDGWRGAGIASSILRRFVERHQPQALVWTHSSETWDGFYRRIRDTWLGPIPGVFNPYLALHEWARTEQR